MLPKDREGIRLLGTSGTVTTLASVHLALPSYDRRAVDGLHVPIDAMREISTMIAEMDFEERASLPCIGPIGPIWSLPVARSSRRSWKSGRPRNLGVADRGIREGILRSLMARDGYKL
jgi:exopolyphosphatase / guanosine-5'-triphosphate,3'-diphosphate pyrophosphatase